MHLRAAVSKRGDSKGPLNRQRSRYDRSTVNDSLGVGGVGNDGRLRFRRHGAVVPVRLFFAKTSRWGSERRILAPSRTTHRSNAVRDGASFTQEPIASARSEQEGRQLRRRKWPNLAMERGRQRQPGDDTPARGKMSVRHSAGKREVVPAKNQSDRAKKNLLVYVGDQYTPY